MRCQRCSNSQCRVRQISYMHWVTDQPSALLRGTKLGHTNVVSANDHHFSGHALGSYGTLLIDQQPLMFHLTTQARAHKTRPQQIHWVKVFSGMSTETSNVHQELEIDEYEVLSLDLYWDKTKVWPCTLSTTFDSRTAVRKTFNCTSHPSRKHLQVNSNRVHHLGTAPNLPVRNEEAHQLGEETVLWSQLSEWAG
jgi:hypothetical protein